MFYVLNFVQFCARKLLLLIVCLTLKFTFGYRVFSTKLYVHQIFGSREFRTIFRVAPKSIWGPLQYTDYACNRKKHITGACDGMGPSSWHRGKEQGVKHVRLVVLLHQLERLTLQRRLSSLECCEKTVCLITEITDIVNSGQTQRKYKSKAAKRKPRVEQKNEMSKLRKRCHFCWHGFETSLISNKPKN